MALRYDSLADSRGCGFGHFISWLRRIMRDGTRGTAANFTTEKIEIHFEDELAIL